MCIVTGEFLCVDAVLQNALESVRVVLVGNKVDLIDKRVISKEQGMQVSV